MTTTRPRYGVRADHDKRRYEVYDVETGMAVRCFLYTKSESSRGIAHGRANVYREDMNRAGSSPTARSAHASLISKG